MQPQRYIQAKPSMRLINVQFDTNAVDCREASEGEEGAL
jgi:hypothetical protein